jgi:hypothetical protein
MQQCDDSFLQKKMSFCFNRPCNLNARSWSQKVGSLKDFEIYGVIEKEPLRNRQKLSTYSARSSA